MTSDPFVGTWELVPAKSDYQFGDPPTRGTYKIERIGNDYRMTMAWTTIHGRDLEMSYEGTPDGVQYPLENSIVADGMSMTRVDELTLDSATFKNIDQIAHARRELSTDKNTMTVTQSGKTPDGDDFANVAIYVRKM